MYCWLPQDGIVRLLIFRTMIFRLAYLCFVTRVHNSLFPGEFWMFFLLYNISKEPDSLLFTGEFWTFFLVYNVSKEHDSLLFMGEFWTFFLNSSL